MLVWNQGSEETSDNTWWYGGGLALKGVVTVTFNRRDDAFGYLAHPELNAESEAENGHSSSGVYGILDHLEVLKWYVLSKKALDRPAPHAKQREIP